MTNQKQSSKRHSVVIAILAVLLVGLLAFNITYAFFTDKETNSDQFTFGTISLKTTGDNVVDVYRQSTKVTGDVMPGDVMTGAFTLGLNTDSENAFARFKLTASPEYGYIFEEGTKAWVEDGASVTAGAVIAYINGELVQATIDESEAVTIYEDGVATPVTGAEADAITEYNTYVEYIVAPGQTQKVTFALNSDDPDNLFVEATVTITEEGQPDVVKTLSANAEEVTEILINDAQNFARTADIETAIDELNNAIQMGTAGAIAGLEPTDFVAPGDGWVYKIAEMKATDAAEVVDLTYTLPITLGNALQDVTINLDLVAQVVQAANVQDANATGAAGWDSISTEHQAVNSIKMFYAALHAHGDILENNVAND